MSFDEIEHTTSLFQKNKFYIVYGKMSFIDSFLSSRRLWIALKYRSYSKCTIKSGTRQNWSVSFFSFFNCLPDDVLCKIAVWADDNAFNAIYDKPSDVPQQAVIWS